MKEKAINMCINEALECLKHGDVPIGAVIVQNDEKIIAKAHNTREISHDILGHAEINVIKLASEALGRWNLVDCDLYVTLKPCSMCMEVIKQCRISNVYFLLDKLSFKKEYSKTKITKIDKNMMENEEKSEQLYHEMLSEFFRKKR